MRKPCASIQIETTPPSLEYRRDYIKDALQVCRLSFHLLCVWAVLDHFISYEIATISSGLRYVFSRTKQQHTQQFQWGSERESHVHLSKCVYKCASNKHKHAFLNSKMWIVDIMHRTCLQFSFAKIKVCLVYTHCISHLLPSFHFTCRAMAMVTKRTQGFEGETWIGGQTKAAGSYSAWPFKAFSGKNNPLYFYICLL